MDPKVIIITGTSKGIGKFLAGHFLAQGWIVAGCSRGPSTLGHAAYRHTSLDVGDEAEVAAMVRSVAGEHGKIDALLNNAGIATMNAALLTPGSSLEKVYRTNTFGAFYCAREAAKVMLRQKSGRIVFFTTVARPMELEGEIAYASSKAAVESITRILSRELGSSGITVNAVGPTPVDTDLIKGVSSEQIQHILERQAIKRMGTLGDIARVVEFFLDERSNFITGQVIYLGGAGS